MPGKPVRPFGMDGYILLLENYMGATKYSVEWKKCILLNCLGAEGQRNFHTLTEEGLDFEEEITCLQIL